MNSSSRQTLTIGVDARSLIGPISGIGRFVHQSVVHLRKAGANVILYMPSQPDESLAESLAPYEVCSSHKGVVGLFLWSNIQLRRCINSDRPDVFWGPAHRLPFRLPPETPAVLTIHDLVWRKAPETMKFRGWLAERLLMGPAVRRADHIAAVSETTTRDLRQLYGSGLCPVTTIHPGVTSLSGQGQGSTNEDKFAKKIILFVGTVEPRKNIDRLLQAWRRLSPNLRSTCQLVLAGRHGWRHQPLDKMIEKQEITESCHYAKNLSDADLAALYSRCHALVLPSLYEGFGLPVVEAQAFGKPVLVSRRGALPEIAGSGALLCDPEDVEDIKTGLEKILTDQAVYADLSKNAHANSLRFNWDKTASELLDVFEQVVG